MTESLLVPSLWCPGGMPCRLGSEGGVSSFSDPHPPATMSLQDLRPKLPLFSCTLYSPTCNAFDKLFLKEVQLPELDVGDWLVFPSMGAYMSTMSSAFSGFPLPSHLLRHGTRTHVSGGRWKGAGQ